MATGNFDVLSEGFGNLGAALSGVGGIEGKRQQLLQQMRAEAEMAQLQKAAELKQQAEDNARAYAEAQQREFERELLAAQGNELPTSGASNADVIRAALNPAPGQMRGGLDPTRAAALFARLDPKAGAGVYNSNLDRRAEYGVDPTPKFDLYGREVDSRINENAAQAFSANASGAHSLGAESRAAELHPTIMGEHDASAAIKRIKQAQAERAEARRTGAPVIPGPWSPETSQEDVDFWMKGQSAATGLNKAGTDAERAALELEKARQPKPSLGQKALVGTLKSTLQEYINVVSGVKKVKSKEKASQELLRQMQRLNPKAVTVDPEDEEKLMLSPDVYQMDDETGVSPTDTGSAVPSVVTGSSWGPTKPKPQ